MITYINVWYIFLYPISMIHIIYVCMVSMILNVKIWCPWYIMLKFGVHDTQFLGLVSMMHNIYVVIHYTECLVSMIDNIYVCYP